MSPREKAQIKLAVDVMTGVAGHAGLRPILLRVFLTGYYFRTGLDMAKAASKAEKMALEIEKAVES